MVTRPDICYLFKQYFLRREWTKSLNSLTVVLRSRTLPGWAASRLEGVRPPRSLRNSSVQRDVQTWIGRRSITNLAPSCRSTLSVSSGCTNRKKHSDGLSAGFKEHLVALIEAQGISLEPVQARGKTG